MLRLLGLAIEVGIKEGDEEEEKEEGGRTGSYMDGAGFWGSSFSYSPSGPRASLLISSIVYVMKSLLMA